MKIKLSLTLMAFALISFVQTGRAQYDIDPIYYYNFSPDSLAGFDEAAARASAISEQFLGAELKVRMYQLKRQYVDNKYGLTKPFVSNTNNYLNMHRPAAVPGCTNEDFEATAAGIITASNQVNGWVVTSGYNGNISSTSSSTMLPYYPGGLSGATSCNLLGCCPLPPQNSEIIDCSAAGGYTDATIGAQYPIYSVFGTGTVSGANAANPQIQGGLFGTKVLRLNDMLTGDYSVEKLSKTFAVTAQNALFQFAFISVFAPGHGCCDAGGFQIRLSNATTNSVIPCPNFSVSAPSSACTNTVPYTYLNVGSGSTYSPNINYGNIYHPWNVNSMDLSAYIGQNITIDVLVSDCTAGGHFGCIYFDAQCGPMTVVGNGQVFDAGSNVTVPTCGASGATICAANGLGPYSWAGPGLTAAQSVPAYSNQCITTTISAQYTLYMNPAGACAPIQRIVNSTVTPAPLLSAAAVQATCGAQTAIVTVTPSGSAANPSTIFWSPAYQSITTNSTQATYTLPAVNNTLIVTVTASDPLGCIVTATANVNPAPPIPTFTVTNATNSSSITCLYPSVNLIANSNYNYNGGSLDYFWASASSTLTTNNVNITIPGNYTVQAYDPITQCGTVQIVPIGVNTVQPSSALTNTYQNISCTSTVANVFSTVSPTINVTQNFLSPTGGTYVVGAFSATYTPGAIGEYTHFVVNDINGCATYKTFTVTSNQGFPVFSLVSPQNYTLGCGSKSFAVVQIVGGSATTGSNQIPNGGAVSYSVLNATSIPPSSTGTLSSISNYTLTSPGSYTVITRDNVNFCETKTPISILSNTFAPDRSAIVPQQILDCYVPEITLTGQSLTDNVSFTWLFPGSPGTLLSNTIQVLANFGSPSSSVIAVYTLEVMDNSSTCTSYSVITMNQNLYAPTAGITNGGVNALTCKTASITLTNNSSTKIPSTTGYPTGAPVVGFLWEGPTPQEPLSNSTTYLARTVGVYTLTAKDLNNGCTSQTTTTILDNIIYPNLNGANQFTLDCGDKSIVTLTVGTSGEPAGNFTYTWSAPASASITDVSSSTLKTNETGLYSVIVENKVNACANRMEMEVVNGTLTAAFAADKSFGYAPFTVNFTNNSTTSLDNENIKSTWNFGNGTAETYSFVSSTKTTYNQPGTYTVTLFVTKGSCNESTQNVIKVDVPSSLTVPNVFTPNGDGVNDLYFVKASNLKNISAVIFDRWGHKVYDLPEGGSNIEWDGTNLQGKECAEGTYFYVIKGTGNDGQTYEEKGTISLLR